MPILVCVLPGKARLCPGRRAVRALLIWPTACKSAEGGAMFRISETWKYQPSPWRRGHPNHDHRRHSQSSRRRPRGTRCGAVHGAAAFPRTAPRRTRWISCRITAMPLGSLQLVRNQLTPIMAIREPRSSDKKCELPRKHALHHPAANCARGP